jgi:hypothetical protein
MLLKFVTALHVSTYFSIIMCFDMRKSCSASCFTYRFLLLAYSLCGCRKHPLIEKSHTKTDSTYGIVGGTILSSYKNVANTKTLISVARKHSSSSKFQGTR